MYLWKQWHESRILSALGLIGLLLLAVLVTKGIVTMNNTHDGRLNSNGPDAIVGILVASFYVEAVLIGCWAWLLGSMGAGKNIGEESGSFLFTRPRTRAWFLWHDWAFGMVLLAMVTTVSGILFSILIHRAITFTHTPASAMYFPHTGIPMHLLPLMILIGIGVLLCTGLVYSLTYLSTIMVKRISGVILGAGIFVGYLVLRAVLHHYYPAVLLPSPLLGLFRIENHHFYGLPNHLALWIVTRALVVLAFPVAAQLVLNRAEV
jgi:hypothetical protein